MKSPWARTYFDLARQQAQAYGDAPAVVSGSSHLSYNGLLRYAERVAASLVAAGCRRGDRIGILAPNCLEWVGIAVGASGAGAAVVPFSTWSTRQELDFLLADSEITLLFSAAQFGDRDFAADLAALMPGGEPRAASGRYPNLRDVVLMGACREGDPFGHLETFLGAANATVDLPPGHAASAGDDGLILYTSGSSAHPKAVRLKHYGIIENGFNIGERQGLREGDRVLISPPLFWSYGSANALPATLTHGAVAVLLEKFEPKAALDVIEAQACTAIYTLPGMTAALLREPGFSRERVRSLRTGLTIGAPQDFREAVEKLGVAELCNVYGATETYGNCCVTWHHWPLERRMNCQGPPLPGNELRFVDAETGLPVAAGQEGLTEVRGYISAGYSGASSDQNAAAFTPDGFYRTGDVGHLNDEGDFAFVGRNTEMIKRAGINVSPVEVENVLALHPHVETAGVVGIPDAERGEMVVAFVVAKAGTTVTAAELIAHCRSIASKYKVPDRIVIRSALPVTPTGKLQRRDLKKDAASLIELKGGGHG